MLVEYVGKQAAVNFIVKGQPVRIAKGDRLLLSVSKINALQSSVFFKQLVKKKEIVIDDLSNFDRTELLALAKSFNIEVSKKDSVAQIIQKLQGNPTGEDEQAAAADEAAEAAKQAEQAKIDEAVAQAVKETEEKAEGEKIKAIAEAVKQAKAEAAEDEAKRQAEADEQRQAEEQAAADKPATKSK